MIDISELDPVESATHTGATAPSGKPLGKGRGDSCDGSLPAKGVTGETPVYVYGAEPYAKVSVSRISELAAAVSRCIGSVELTRPNVKRIRTWARELEEQLDLLDTMLIYEEAGNEC